MSRVNPIAIVVTVGVVVLGTQAASGGRALTHTTSGRPVEIVVSSRTVAGRDAGTFTLTGAATKTGRSVTVANVSHATRVMKEQAFEGTSPGHVRLYGRRSSLTFATSGRYVAVTISGISTMVMIGTWRITGGTGVYTRWRGGGRFVSASRAVAPTSAGGQGNGGSIFDARYEGVIVG